MMVVDVFSHTGFLDYASVKVSHCNCTSPVVVYAYFMIQACKLTKGKKWPLIILLCTITAVVSAFLVSHLTHFTLARAHTHTTHVHTHSTHSAHKIIKCASKQFGNDFYQIYMQEIKLMIHVHVCYRELRQ